MKEVSIMETQTYKDDFQYSLKLGKITEEKLKKYLLDKGYRIDDVRDDEKYRKIDVDFIVYREDNLPILVEVKHDSKIIETGNLFFENSMKRKTGEKPGWVQYCEADYIFFHCSQEGQLYLVDWKNHKQDMLNYSRFLSDCKIGTTGIRGSAYIINKEKAKTHGLLCGQYPLQ